MKIKAIKKDSEGKIKNYKLDNGQVVDRVQCISMVKEGKIENCNIGVSKTGEEFVRTDRDDENGKHIKNLSELPNFK